MIRNAADNLIGNSSAKTLAVMPALIGVSLPLVIDFDLNFFTNKSFSEKFTSFEQERDSVESLVELKIIIKAVTLTLYL